MRELLTSEVNLVSGAGVDWPNIQNTVNVSNSVNTITNIIQGSSGTSIGSMTQTVSNALKPVDAALSQVWENISKLLHWKC